MRNTIYMIANEYVGLLDDAYLFRQGDEYFLVVKASTGKKLEIFIGTLKNFDVSHFMTKLAQIAMIASEVPFSEKILLQ